MLDSSRPPAEPSRRSFWAAPGRGSCGRFAAAGGAFCLGVHSGTRRELSVFYNFYVSKHGFVFLLSFSSSSSSSSSKTLIKTSSTSTKAGGLVLKGPKHDSQSCCFLSFRRHRAAERLVGQAAHRARLDGGGAKRKQTKRGGRWEIWEVWES